MKLINRYVTEVGKRLPLIKGRKDIEDELRSTLEDMLEDRAQKAGRPADETLEIELLQEYGAPDKVAATYNPNPYLIGPRMFPFFMMTLKIVISIVTVVLIVTTGIQIVSQSPMSAMDLLNAIGKGLLNVISAAIAAFGNMALVFAVIERFVPAKEFEMNEDKEWDPATLLQEPEPTEVKMWEPIVAIIGGFIAFSIFNFNPQLVGIYNLKDGVWTVTPILTDAFWKWLPLINIAWIAEIILNGMLLRNLRWTPSARLFSIAIKAFQIVIGFILITGTSIITATPEAFSEIFDPEAAQTLAMMAQQGVRGLIGLTMFLEAVEILKQLAKLATKK